MKELAVNTKSLLEVLGLEEEPFGAGCGHLVAWPLYYRRLGLEKAVLGGFDPSARKYMATDEMTFTVSLNLYERMLEAAPSSALYQNTWAGVRKKVLRSYKQWAK